MATISLYASKINNMPELIKDVKKSVKDYKSELSNLRNKSFKVNKSICDLDEVISAISTSTQTQEEKIESLETFQNNSEQFITDTVKIDGDVADIVNQNKNDFYNKYCYLKPECEKSGWEKFCDGCKKVGEWCRDNWKSIVKIVVAVVIIAALGIASVLTGGALAVILAGAFWGALIGGAFGGITGGIISAMSGGSFLEGFADGALSGAIGGAITGGFTAALGPATTLLQGIGRGAGIGALSTSISNIAVTTIDYAVTYKTLAGSFDDILISGLSGAVFGGIFGGIMGGVQFKSPSQTAKSWQGTDDYPGIDNYVDINVKKGTVLYRGEPNGSEYFTTLDAIKNSDHNATQLFEGLQVKPHDVYGYRGQVSGYAFNKTVTVGYGTALANPQYGAGGQPQFFIPNVQKLIDKDILVLVDTIDLIK